MATNSQRIDEFIREVNALLKRMNRAEDWTEVGPNNPAYQIISMVAEEVLPFFRDAAPELTGLLKESHRVGERSIKKTSGGVIAEAVIDIDPDTRENELLGGFPRDYGPKYHRERRPWFEEASFPAREVMDMIVDQQFQLWLDILAF